MTSECSDIVPASVVSGSYTSEAVPEPAHTPLVLGVEAGPTWTTVLTALAAAVEAEGMQWRSCTAAGIGAALTEVSNRAVAICGFGPTAAPAVRGAAEDGRVGAMVLLDPELDAETVELISAWPEVAVLAGADPSHRPELASAVDAYLASIHAGSYLLAEAFDEFVWSQVARSGPPPSWPRPARSPAWW